MAERLVLCGVAKRAGTELILRLALDGRSQNVTLKLEDISKRLVQNVPDLQIDLIEIASYVYCADQATSRGGDAQVGMGSGWRRGFRFVIPVRDPNHWSNPRVWSRCVIRYRFCQTTNTRLSLRGPRARSHWTIIWIWTPTMGRPLRLMKLCCFRAESIPEWHDRRAYCRRKKRCARQPPIFPQKIHSEATRGGA